jgi:hypothetical protein
VLFAAGDLCTTGEVVSATVQAFEPTERRSCHGIGTVKVEIQTTLCRCPSPSGVPLRNRDVRPLCTLAIANIKYKKLMAIENPALIKRSTVIEKDLRL